MSPSPADRNWIFHWGSPIVLPVPTPHWKFITEHCCISIRNYATSTAAADTPPHHQTLPHITGTLFNIVRTWCGETERHSRLNSKRFPFMILGSGLYVWSVSGLLPVLHLEKMRCQLQRKRLFLVDYSSEGENGLPYMS